MAVDDSAVRRWLKESDRGNKGFVDFSDYEAIYQEASGPRGVGAAGRGSGSGSGFGSKSSRGSASPEKEKETQRYGALDVGLAGSGSSRRPGADKAAAAERLALLKR